MHSLTHTTESEVRIQHSCSCIWNLLWEWSVPGRTLWGLRVQRSPGDQTRAAAVRLGETGAEVWRGAAETERRSRTGGNCCSIHGNKWYIQSASNVERRIELYVFHMYYTVAKPWVVCSKNNNKSNILGKCCSIHSNKKVLCIYMYVVDQLHSGKFSKAFKVFWKCKWISYNRKSWNISSKQ